LHVKIEMEKQGMIVVARLGGRFDANTAGEFDSWFGNQIQAGEARFVIEMTKLEYISSAGLRSLLSAAKRTKTVAGRIVLCGLSGPVAEVIEVSGFQKIFPLAETLDEAKSMVG
jgi:anti-anti-sigma factor